MTTKGPSKSAAALRSVLQNHTASEIPSSGEVIEISASVTPIEAAKVLWKHNIIGAPVWDESKKVYIGFFDMRDILSAVIASHKEHLGEDDTSTATHTEVMTKWFAQMHVSTTYLAARNPFVSCKAETSLEDVCRRLSEERCHRIPVVNTDGRCVKIISQSALVKFLVDHIAPDTAESLEETLDQASFVYRKDIISAPDTASAVDVFEMLDSHRLSGIAVVDAEDGRLVGNTSARDIKLAVVDAGTRTAQMMDMDILSYLAAVRQATPVKKERYPSAHVSETSTVSHAIRLLAKTGYHRVFVVDKETKPVGVISVADIVRFVVG